jgi:hypothetical protein
MRNGLRTIVALVLSAFVSSETTGAEPLIPDSRLGVRTVPLLLLSRPDVRADLGLTENQTREAEDAIRSLYPRAREMAGKQGEDAVAARRAVDNDMQQWIESRLNESQRERLAQIDLQWEGPAAVVSRPSLADALELSTGQREALTKGVAEVNEKRRKGTLDARDEAALARQTLGLLTKTQRTRWRAMLGKPFVPRLAAAEAKAKTQ